MMFVCQWLRFAARSWCDRWRNQKTVVTISFHQVHHKHYQVCQGSPKRKCPCHQKGSPTTRISIPCPRPQQPAHGAAHNRRQHQGSQFQPPHSRKCQQNTLTLKNRPMRRRLQKDFHFESFFCFVIERSSFERSFLSNL